MKWPRHHSMFINHNDHLTYYETIKEYLERPHLKDALSDEDYNQCIERNEIWECQIYPITPTSFVHIVVPTWKRLEEEIHKMCFSMKTIYMRPLNNND